MKPSRKQPTQRPGVGLLGGLAAAIGTLLVLAGLVPLSLGLFPELQVHQAPLMPNAPALIASFIPFGILLWAVAFVLLVPQLLRARRRGYLFVVSAVAALGLAVQGSWLAPHFFGAVPTTSKPMTVLSLNVLSGQGDPEQIVKRAAKADFVVLTETSPGTPDELAEAGIAKRFPHVVGADPEDVSNTTIYSRWPITDSHRIRLGFDNWITKVETPEHGSVNLVGVHPMNPTYGSERWNAEGSRLFRELRPLAGEKTIVAGDFNAIDRHLTMRRLLDSGYTDASVQANGGWSPTWPVNDGWSPTSPVSTQGLPPMVQIDHVLLGAGLKASAIDTFAVDGTDHLGVTARVG